MLAAVAGLAIAVALLLTMSSGGPGTAATSLSAKALREAADVTANEPGYRLSMTMSMVIGNQTIELSEDGSWSGVGTAMRGAGEVVMDGKHVSEVFAYPYVYMRSPAGTHLYDAPTPWTKFNLNGFTQAIGIGSMSLSSSSDPASELQYLQSVGSVTDAGSAQVDGVSTTHYYAVLDASRAPAKYAAFVERYTGQSTLPVQVWVDSQHRVRRMTMSFGVCTKSYGTINEQMTLDWSDFGPQPVVEPPPAAQVTDVTSTLAAFESHAMASVGC
jgi:hypothetical protein